MISTEFLVFTAEEMNQYLEEQIDYDCFFKIEDVQECYCKGRCLSIFTSATTYEFNFTSDEIAKEWYQSIKNQVITHEI